MNAPLSPAIFLDSIKAERLKRSAERSLIEFTKQAFHIIEPGVEFKDNWHLHAIADHLEAVSEGEIENLLINIPPGCMKLCADHTPVPTPDGWRKHGDLKIGDRVFGPSGEVRNIIAISQEGPADRRVSFSNGEVIECNGDHLWTVFDRWSRKWRTVNTEYLLRSNLRSGKHYRFQLPDYSAHQHSEKKLLLDPYFLGCWIGDGTYTKPLITHHVDDAAHIAKIVSKGYVVSTIHKTGPNTLASSFTHQGISGILRKLGVFKNKHIPEIYLQGSIEQRLELLAGLIDTDGYVRKDGRVDYITCDERIAKDVEKLCFSLGFRVSVMQRKAPGWKDISSEKTVYTLAFHPNRHIPTALPRKKILRLDAMRRAVTLNNVEVVDNPAKGHCITVEHPDGLYLVGTSCVVTHNSILVSVAWPAWEWINRPNLRYLGASYGGDLAIRDAMKCRDIITSDWFKSRWPGIDIKKGSDQKLKYELTSGGWRMATSVGGRATGEHPDRKIVDDPHNAKQAESETERKGAIDWFDRTLSSRGQSRGARTVVVMQRLNELDVSGHIIAEDFGYEHLCIPMRYETPREGKKKAVSVLGWSDPRSVEGALLWPELFPEKSVQKLEKLLGSYGTAGQLQQRPSPEGGGILKVKHFQLWKDPNLPVFDHIVQSYDGAYTEKTTNDPTACTVWGCFEDPEGRRAAMLLDAWDDHIAYPQLRKRLIKDWTIPYGAKDGDDAKKIKPRKGRRADIVLIENKSSGISLKMDLRASNIPVHSYDPGKADKVSRAHNAAPVLELDVLYVLESTAEPGKPITWARDFIDQCEKFPNAAHDDYVDTFTQAVIYLRDNNWIDMPDPDEDEDDDDEGVDVKKKRTNPYSQ